MVLICKICFENASSHGASHAQPRVTPCGHIFCHSCATTWFRTEADCPVCRRRVEGLSSLILLYDQDAGFQSSPLDPLGDESGIDAVADPRIHCWPHHIGVDNLARGFPARSPGSAPMDNGGAVENPRNLEARNIRERETADIGQKHARDDEDVQVRFVLGKVAERWQLVMLERAKLKMQVASLDKAKQDLLSQLQRLSEENNALREALNSRNRSANRRRGTQTSGTDANNHHDGWDTRFVEDAVTTHNSRRHRGDMDLSPLLHQESCYMGCETGVGRAFSTPSERILERLRVNNWELAHTFATHSGPVHGIAVNPSGNLVATASWDNVCKVYDVHSEEEVAVLSGHEHGLYAVKFSPSKCNVVGTVSSDHTCRLWNAENGECLGVLEGHTDEVNGLAFKNGTHLLATASDDMTGKIWDAEKGAWITDLKGHRHAVYGICFQPQGRLIATASFDLTVKLWDLRLPDCIGTLKGHLEDVIGVDFDSSGNILATGSDDKTCRVWDLRTCNVLKVLNEHGGEVKRVVFSPYGCMLATTCGDTTVRLFETSTFHCCHVLSSHSDHVFDVAWSPTAEFLVTASHDHFWKLWLPKSMPLGYTTGSSKFTHMENLRITHLDEREDRSYNS